MPARRHPLRAVDRVHLRATHELTGRPEQEEGVRPPHTWRSRLASQSVHECPGAPRRVRARHHRIWRRARGIVVTSVDRRHENRVSSSEWRDRSSSGRRLSGGLPHGARIRASAHAASRLRCRFRERGNTAPTTSRPNTAAVRIYDVSHRSSQRLRRVRCRGPIPVPRDARRLRDGPGRIRCPALTNRR